MRTNLLVYTRLRFRTIYIYSRRLFVRRGHVRIVFVLCVYARACHKSNIETTENCAKHRRTHTDGRPFRLFRLGGTRSYIKYLTTTEFITPVPPRSNRIFLFAFRIVTFPRLAQKPTTVRTSFYTCTHIYIYVCVFVFGRVHRRRCDTFTVPVAVVVVANFHLNRRDESAPAPHARTHDPGNVNVWRAGVSKVLN